MILCSARLNRRDRANRSNLIATLKSQSALTLELQPLADHEVRESRADLGRLQVSEASPESHCAYLCAMTDGESAEKKGHNVQTYQLTIT